jgi:class 3 adenylate cyclase
VPMTAQRPGEVSDRSSLGDPSMSEETRIGGDELGARVGELRRLTFMYCDVVGSTELSGRLEPETYRDLLRAYRHACRDIIETRFDGHILRIKGDGALSIFGFPAAHENDAERAVRAGLALVRAVCELPGASSTAGEPPELRVGIHHGPVYMRASTREPNTCARRSCTVSGCSTGSRAASTARSKPSWDALRTWIESNMSTRRRRSGSPPVIRLCT